MARTRQNRPNPRGDWLKQFEIDFIPFYCLFVFFLRHRRITLLFPATPTSGEKNSRECLMPLCGIHQRGGGMGLPGDDIDDFGARGEFTHAGGKERTRSFTRARDLERSNMRKAAKARRRSEGIASVRPCRQGQTGRGIWCHGVSERGEIHRQRPPALAAAARLR